MYFDHAKRNYYRFPSKNGITELDAQMPFYFPEKDSYQDSFNPNFFDSTMDSEFSSHFGLNKETNTIQY